FLWYTVVDNHVLNFARQRVFPDGDVPLGPLHFLGVTLGAFLPWSLAAPWVVTRALRPPWPNAEERLWGLLALWAVLVIGFFTLSPFRLPHYGLPAFPALALLVARAWDECIEALPGALAPRVLLAPIAVLFALAGVGLVLGALGRIPLPAGALESVDEGPIEGSGALLLVVKRPLHVVHGLQSNLAFGASFPEARDLFWGPARLGQAWTAPGRCFLVSTIAPSRSVVGTLAPVHLLAEGG